MGRENPAQSVPIMLGGTLAVDLSGSGIEKSEQVGGAIAPVNKVLKDGLIGGHRQVGRDTVECLNAGALVKAIQVLWRIRITGDDMFHFGKEIRIGDLQVVLAAVGPQGMLRENPLDG